MGSTYIQIIIDNMKITEAEYEELWKKASIKKEEDKEEKSAGQETNRKI